MTDETRNALPIAVCAAAAAVLAAAIAMPAPVQAKSAEPEYADILPSAVDKYYIEAVAADTAESAQDGAEAVVSSTVDNYSEPYYVGPAYETWAPEIWGNDPSTLPPEIQNGSGLTQSGGVNYWNGTRETWYSSNTLYHYRTSEWTPDESGFYRTSEGYYVVASSDYPQGTVIETSQGQAQVLDSGCASGTVDFYVNWN